MGDNLIYALLLSFNSQVYECQLKIYIYISFARTSLLLFSRPGQSQGLLYKQPRDSLIH